MMDEDVNKDIRDPDPETIQPNVPFELYEYETEPVWADESGQACSIFRGQKWLSIVIACALAFILGGGLSYSIYRMHSPSNEIVTGTQGNESGTAPVSDAITVDIHGDVLHPGLYHLPANARVLDAIAAAGGYLHKVDSQSVNQAQPLVDGQEVVISSSAPTYATAMSNGTTETFGSPENSTADSQNPKIDINTADVATLETITGIGPKRAQAIIAYRNEHGPFKSVADLRHVRGFGKATLAKLSAYIFV